VPKVLEVFGLAGKKSACQCGVSGGERQRVAIAARLVRQPKIVIADEPTGNPGLNTWDVVRVLEEVSQHGAAVAAITTTKTSLTGLERGDRHYGWQDCQRSNQRQL